MLISGIQQFTLLDYPDKTACIVFTPGCNFRCGFCHNPEFVLPEEIEQIKDSFIPEAAFFRFLEERQGLLDGVVITGGEPTLMGDLLPFIEKIKEMGFLVKLDSNGNTPQILKKIVETGLVDYVAMDIKTILPKYKELVGSRVREAHIQEAISFIKDHGIDHEFRSTIIKEVHTPDVLQGMAVLVEGARRYFLQNFRPEKTLDPAFEHYHGFSESELYDIRELFVPVVAEVGIRS